MAGVSNERDSELAIWAAKLRDFLSDCVGSAASEETVRIQEAALLLREASALCAGLPDPAAIDAMLACGAGESAVLAILHPQLAFMLSRGGGGSCLATVVGEDGSDEMISEGATVALALLAAYVSLLLARSQRYRAEMDASGLPPAGRLH